VYLQNHQTLYIRRHTWSLKFILITVLLRVLDVRDAETSGLGTVFNYRIIRISGISASGLKEFLCIQVRGIHIKLGEVLDTLSATWDQSVQLIWSDG
jgi:hypothetical protein